MSTMLFELLFESAPAPVLILFWLLVFVFSFPHLSLSLSPVALFLNSVFVLFDALAGLSFCFVSGTPD